MGYLFNSDVKSYTNLLGKPVPVSTKTILLKIKLGEEASDNGVIYSDLFTNTETGIHISFSSNKIKVTLQNGNGTTYVVSRTVDIGKTVDILIEHDNVDKTNNLKLYINDLNDYTAINVPLVTNTQSSRTGCLGRVRSDITSYQSNDLSIYEFVIWDTILTDKSNMNEAKSSAIHRYNFLKSNVLEDIGTSTDKINGEPHNISMVNLYHYIIKENGLYYTTNMSSYDITQNKFVSVNNDIEHCFNDVDSITEPIETFKVVGESVTIEDIHAYKFNLSDKLEMHETKESV